MSAPRPTPVVSLHCREPPLWAHEPTYAVQQTRCAVATSYSITSSAVASNVGGTVRPSILAVSAS
jgi:hypothetical protein